MSQQWNYGCMFPGSLCHTWTVTNGNILYSTFFSLMRGDATHIFTSILLLHALHTLDCNCTCQNNPRLSFGLFWWCGRLFLFLLTHHHLAHVCFILSHSLSFIKIFFHHYGWWCNSSSLSSSYTPPSTCVISYHSSQLSSQCHVFLHMHKTTSTK